MYHDRPSFQSRRAVWAIFDLRFTSEIIRSLPYARSIAQLGLGTLLYEPIKRMYLIEAH